MRNLLWRGLAVALAGCVSWLLWHWPAPRPPEPVEMDIFDCQHKGLFTAEDLARCEKKRVGQGMEQSPRA